MKKKDITKLFSYLLAAFALFAFILISGCSLYHSKKEDNAYEVSSETFHKIETIELKEAEKEDVVKSAKTKAAPAEFKLSLEECRAFTLENNLDLKVQLINPAIAKEYINQEEARFESTFTALAIYSKTNTPVATTLEIAGNQVDTTYADLGVNIPLRSGGTIQFNLTDQKNKTDSPYSIYNPSYNSKVTASISQPLLRNAGKRVNTYGIRVAEYNSQITDAGTKLAVIRIVADVDKAYWQLYATRRLLDVRKQQYDLAQSLLDQTKKLVEVGIKPEIELLRTKAGVAESLENIITAENSVRDMERYLKRTLNKADLGMETETELILSTEPDPVRYDIDKEKMVADALNNRMDMLELEIQLAQDSSTIEYRRNQLLPLVTMEYRYGTNGLGASRGDSYDTLIDNDFKDHYFGLSVSVPLGNKSAKSQLRQSIYERARRLATRDSKKAQIKYEVLQQIDQLEASWQHIMASRQTTILRDQQCKAEKRQYELGMLTATDVLQAQTDLADAQQMEILAITQYEIGLVDLAYATGTLLGAAKVEWEPIVPGK